MSLNTMNATDLRDRLANGSLTAVEVMEAHLERIRDRDEAVGAWVHLDPEKAFAAARAADDAGRPGRLAGLPVAVKDIIDTADMPTGYGSSIHALHQPTTDAACVAATRAQGGIVLGKTVTTEFAWRNPGKTKNPWNPKHTPGGSSSGSAAGVADGQAAFGFGTQTAGSIIRPAAYCGIVGYKPTRGTHDRSGVKELSGHFDTVGTFARTVADIALFDYALRDQDAPSLDIGGATLRLGLMIPYRGEADASALTAFETAYKAAEAAGATLKDIPSSLAFETVGDDHAAVMTGEAGRALSWEYEHHPERLIRYYRDNIATGRAIGDAELQAARDRIDAAAAEFSNWFQDVDVLLTLPAPGEAPADLTFTGDPIFNKVWTALGWPCVTVPCGKGPGGLPLGVQIVGPNGEDAKTLAAAAWIERLVA